MPYFSVEHVKKALDYLPSHTHSALMSLLAMTRAGVPATDDLNDAIAFGGGTERVLMEDYFKPAGGPDGRPYFVPLGQNQGKTRWREPKYPGSSLQRQRTGKTNIFKQKPSDNKLWTLARDLTAAIKSEPPQEVVGDLPVSIAYLATWSYRDREIASINEAVESFADEFKLSAYGLVPEVFSATIPSDLSAIPLGEKPIDAGELLRLLQTLEPERPDEGEEEAAAIETTATLSGPVSKVHVPAAPPGDWSITVAELGDLCGLKGMDEAATRALAALAAGVHVIFTGPPGSGKTTLAACICDKAGFPSWTVPATDQWTTFETIGGYFPSPADEGGDRLDFFPGAVVDTLERGLCLIIDEINRADIDKAFGELFTLLSGNSVVLPYQRRGGDGKFHRVRLQVGSAVIEDETADVVVVPEWWRIIGSMNDADKASLKRLSMAFVRRFAFIPVDLPSPPIYEELIRTAVARTDAVKTGVGDMDGLAKTLIDLFCRSDKGLGGIGLPLGPSFPLSIVRHADSEWRLVPTRDLPSILASAFELYIVPQLQGRPDLHGDALDLLGSLLGDHRNNFDRHLAVWTGFVPG